MLRNACFSCLDYIVIKENVDAICAVTEVCKHISEISQQFRDPKSRHWFILTPDQLYYQYLELFFNLPSETTKWTISWARSIIKRLLKNWGTGWWMIICLVYLLRMGSPSKEDSVADLRVVRYPSYLSKFLLYFNSCFTYGSTTHLDNNMCPMKKQKFLYGSFLPLAKYT